MNLSFVFVHFVPTNVVILLYLLMFALGYNLKLLSSHQMHFEKPNSVP